MSTLKVLDCVVNNNWGVLCDLYCVWNNQGEQQQRHERQCCLGGNPPFSWLCLTPSELRRL
ncbi:unnamed protein product [Gadus morhua 'NCC']